MYFAEKRDLSRRQIKYLNILFEYNIKIIYRSRSQNLKINALIRIIECKLINPQNERLKQQHQIILTSNRLNFDDIEFDIKIIDNPFYYKIFEINKADEECDDIREAIINEKNKLKGITLSKCVIINDILYHKNRL